MRLIETDRDWCVMKEDKSRQRRGVMEGYNIQRTSMCLMAWMMTSTGRRLGHVDGIASGLCEEWSNSTFLHATQADKYLSAANEQRFRRVSGLHEPTVDETANSIESRPANSCKHMSRSTPPRDCQNVQSAPAGWSNTAVQHLPSSKRLGKNTRHMSLSRDTVDPSFPSTDPTPCAPSTHPWS